MPRRDDRCVGGSDAVKWSDIDKVRFYSIGTAAYSFLTVALHPVTVIKTRQQVLDGPASGGAGKPGVAAAATAFSPRRQPALASVIRDAALPVNPGRSAALDGARSLFRGLPIILCLAVPARALYISVLERGREGIGDALTTSLLRAYEDPEEAKELLPLVATVSGGLAGGIAALSAQVIVVPMDVVSQRQMAMDDETYRRRGRVADVSRAVVQAEGWTGLYRGFGLSILSSLPTGFMWWATYGGCQHKLQPYVNLREGEDRASITYLTRRGTVQLASGLSAAMVAATLTQPLDVIKTRLQVGVVGRPTAQADPSGNSLTAAQGRVSPMLVVRELLKTSGVRGFLKGTVPRIAHMGLWGTALSSAYEVLREVSQKA